MFKQLSKIKLTQDLMGFTYFENFLVATVLTILCVRFFLEITGYPQLGGSGLHIAHMLWGGLLLMLAFLLLHLFMDRRIKLTASIIGGIGFGLFIDELGKFVTSDNNYFFQPSIAIIYLLLVILFLIIHLMKNRMVLSKDEYVSNVLDIYRDSLVHGITLADRERVDKYLKEAKVSFNLDDLSKLTKIKLLDRQEKKFFISKFWVNIKYYFQVLLQKKNFQIAVVILIEIQAIVAFLVLAFVAIYLTGILPSDIHQKILLDLDFAGTLAIVSSFIAGTLAISGVLVFRRSRKRAFELIKYSLLISIFIVQFFVFWVDQLGGLVGLVLNVIALEVVNMMLEKHQVK